MSLKKHATKGILWVAVERFGQQLLQGVIFIILARLLTPADFGLVGMLMIFFALSLTFVDSGMGQALIRQQGISDEDRSTVFWFNLLLSLFFYGVLYISAPWIAEFYEQPKLIDLMRVMGLNVLFFAIAVVQRAEMTQQLQFKKQALAQVPAMAISGGISIWMAYAGYGVWAIAAQYLVSTLLGSILLWLLQPVRIRVVWSRSSFTKLFGFGYKLLLSGLLITTFDHIYKLVIGKMYSVATLGFYTQAQKLQQMVSNNITMLIQKVSYPLLAKVGFDKGRLKSGYKQVIQASSFIIFPMVSFLAIMAKPIITLLLGSQWVEAVPYLQVLCLSGMVYHISAINLNLLKVVGRSDLVLRLALIKQSIMVVAIVVGLQFGIWGLLIAQAITSFISMGINIFYTGRFIDYKTGEQIKDMGTIFGFLVPFLGILWYTNAQLPVYNIFILILVFIGFIGLYLVANVMFKTTQGLLALELIVSRIKNNH